MRRIGAPPEELVIRRNDQFVRLVAYLDRNAAERYRVPLQTVDSEAIWRSPVIKTRPVPDGRRLTVVMPASLFKDKNYFIKLDGLTQGSQRASSDEYALSVRNERLKR